MYRNLCPQSLGVSGTQSELIELALSFGFQGLDIDMVDFADQVREYGMARARRLIDSARIRVSSFRLPLDVGQSDPVQYQKQLEALRGVAQVAGELGCTRAVARISPGSNERAYHENFELHRQRLVEVAGVLSASGVRLGLGFTALAAERKRFKHEFIHDPDALLVLIDVVGSGHVGIWLDAWELYAAGSNLGVLRSKLRPGQIVGVTLSDAPADVAPSELTAADRLLPAETNVIDGVGVLTALVEMGYQGPVTPAAATARLAGMRRDAIVRTAGERLLGLWGAAGLTVQGRMGAAVRA
jgi:sugar phosphate isomerase/epimerase